LGDAFKNYRFDGIGNLNETHTWESNKDIRSIRAAIKADLQKYFDDHKPRFASYYFKDHSQNNNSLELEIINSVGAVTNDRYFEHIVISFTFKKNGKGTTIIYEMEGKYAAGILWAPYQSRYRPMKPKYDEQIRNFTKEIGHRLLELKITT
jgi:hypothetical protein